MGDRVLKLTVAYDGTDFRGFAAQLEQRTVEAALRDVLERIVRREQLVLTCAGRTDAGVHAWGQVVSVPIGDADVDIDKLPFAVTRQLGPEVVVRDAAIVDAPFDARRDATWRTYRYTIVNRPAPDPFLARTAWWVPEPLDLSLLRLGTDPFLGLHDFAAFCRKRTQPSTTMRRVLDAAWLELGDGVLRFDITASAFCTQMVRAIVGTLVDVGVGRIRPGEILGILRARDRSARGRVGVPEGLCLWEVGY
ncbi:MAG TPA: tRNA pseudouridine(38-40) synthase TruA [Acidimicrobiia bacterium]